jgi:hypothetical protein
MMCSLAMTNKTSHTKYLGTMGAINYFELPLVSPWISDGQVVEVIEYCSLVYNNNTILMNKQR